MRGRTYISEVFEYRGKTGAIPVNFTYREANDFAARIGIKTNEDEKEMRLVGYEAVFEPKPAPDCDRRLVRDTDRELSNLTPDDAALVMKTCAAFEIPFGCVLNVIKYLKNIKKGVHNDD